MTLYAVTAHYPRVRGGRLERAKEDKRVQKILADSGSYPVSLLELLAKNAETTGISGRLSGKERYSGSGIHLEFKEGEFSCYSNGAVGYLHYGDGSWRTVVSSCSTFHGCCRFDRKSYIDPLIDRILCRCQWLFLWKGPELESDDRGCRSFWRIRNGNGIVRKRCDRGYCNKA